MENRRFLKIEELKVCYDTHSALWDIQAEIPLGKTVGIIGPNGAGKSTLIKGMLGIVKPLTGRVLFCGEPLMGGSHLVAYVPQRSQVDWEFPITVLEVALMGLYRKLGPFRWVKKEHKQQAKQVLHDIGLAGYENHQISQLSGGQQQRLFIARALLQDADCYFFDEPFTGIDLTTEKLIVEIFHELKKQGKTLLVVHHDLNTACEYFDWALLLNRHLVANGPMKEVFTVENLEKAYGKNHQIFDEAIRRSKECLQV